MTPDVRAAARVLEELGVRRFKVLQEGVVRIYEAPMAPEELSRALALQNVAIASKFLAMGMPLQDVLYRVTRAPALSIHRPELGTLDVGACADIAVLRNREGKFGYMDCGGARLTGEGKLECVATLREGEVVFDPEARSMPDWQNAPAPYWTAPGTTRSWTLWK